MRLADFDYDLPEALIAQEPPPERDGGRLLLLRRATGDITHHRVRDLPTLLAEGDQLVLNDTRVVPARVQLRRRSGGAVELFLVEEQSEQRWLCMARSSKRLRAGEELAPSQDGAALVTLRELGSEGFWQVELHDRQALRQLATLPLPPYIRRSPTAEDLERYQTVFARSEGAVAAPTAGLHFTPDLITHIEARGAQVHTLTLHVGPGTFKPVRSATVEEHVMGQERYCVPSDTAFALASARERRQRVIAVGTTVVRALEATAGQAGEGRTDLFIYPGFRFQVVDALMTNFHLPKSTLLMLVSAFAGRERVLAAYREAVAREYRFYSYGDAMLIL